jgi:hypothetical protein
MKRRVPVEGLLLALISVIYWICAGLRAIYRPMWHDELYTWHVAQLPDVRSMWNALHAGADQNLPLWHLVVRITEALFGPGEFAMRLPSLVSFWIMLLCLYLFLRRRLPAPYAFAGMLVPAVTFAWQYSFEARSYGLLLASGAVALAAWQSAAEDRMRPWSLIVMTLALAIGVSCHFAGTQLAIPFVAAEIVRSVRTRRIDAPMWIAFAVAALGAFVYPGMLAPTRDWDLHGLRPTLATLSTFYGSAYRITVTPMVLAGVAAYLFRLAFPPEAEARVGKDFRMPEHETVAIVGFLLAPGVFFVAGMAMRHFIYAQRYGVLTAIGAGGLAALLLYRLTAADRRAAAIFALVLGGWLTMSRAKEAFGELRPPAQQVREENPVLMQALLDGRPVVVANQQLLLEAEHYLPTEIMNRAYYLVDWGAGRNYIEQDEANQLTTRAARFFALKAHVELFDRFIARTPQFLLHTDERYQQWLYDLLLRRGWKLTMKSRVGAESLIEVNAP